VGLKTFPAAARYDTSTEALSLSLTVGADPLAITLEK